MVPGSWHGGTQGGVKDKAELDVATMMVDFPSWWQVHHEWRVNLVTSDLLLNCKDIDIGLLAVGYGNQRETVRVYLRYI